ncbi:MAG: hypothetical protein K9H64_07790 [Bacteroidales bacterium]|nr:hypothetical protein [Bacteroidales bacterium]MCF8455658.1 hypothetical protein [Bacteroidales bacterium]
MAKQEELQKLKEDLVKQGERLDALTELGTRMGNREQRTHLTFNEFLNIASRKPHFIFRDIYQLFHDMVMYFIPGPIDEYEGDPLSIGLMHYDCENLFEKDCDVPFFADNLFANRLISIVKAIKQGTNTNRILLFEGPPGSGKSTFLNNLLQKLEEYSYTEEGKLYKTHWRLDIQKLGGFKSFEKEMEKIAGQAGDAAKQVYYANQAKQTQFPARNELYFSCPNHDHPILQIPKSYRKVFLMELIKDDHFKHQLFNKKEYEWVLKENPCSICTSLYITLLNRLRDPLKVFEMLYVKPAKFSRQFGVGISIFYPGDELTDKPLKKENLQQMLNDLLRSDNVKLIQSHLGLTNNGVLALMDIKGHNIERLNNLHGIISDGVHKVELIEERIKSLFVGLVNPDDKKHYEKIPSFKDRVISVKIPYILDNNTEVAIYKNKFGDDMGSKFLPSVLEYFARIIIATRIDKKSEGIDKWLKDKSKYTNFLDSQFLLLKMDIYTGKIPAWLTDTDLKAFNKNIRKEIIDESEEEGLKGISGRESIFVFNQFLSKHKPPEKLITIEEVTKFFKDSKDLMTVVPDGFLDSLINMYDFQVLQEVKEAAYLFNKKQISTDIMNYMYAINFDPIETVTSTYTKDKLEITEDYFSNFESIFLGSAANQKEKKEFRDEQLQQYISKTLAQEINLKDTHISNTEQFNNLFERYTKNLKEHALVPFADNENFKRAIQDYGSLAFEKYDSRLRNSVSHLIKNLMKNFGYSLEGAILISIYVIDKKLVGKFV